MQYLLKIRRAQDRGHANHGWLDTYHTFRFADYYDPEHRGVGPLMVLNQDRIQGGTGFGPHAHRDMEIVSIVLEGQLLHMDNLGNEARIQPNEVQRMRAGTGVVHAEYNALEDAETEFLQIWIRPKAKDLPPGYEQKPVSKQARGIQCLVSPATGDGLVAVEQDAWIHGGPMVAGTDAPVPDVPPGLKRGYLHVAKGTFEVAGVRFEAGDGAYLLDLPSLHGQTLRCINSGYVLWFQTDAASGS